MPIFKQVDVFTNVKYKGNAVAVLFDADDLTTEEMQAIARWTNLSETTFVVRATKPEADYRVRIFTPGCELPFAGHPTLGTAYALLEEGRIVADGGKLIQECDAGLVEISVSGDVLSFQLPYFRMIDVGSDVVKQVEMSLGRKVVGVPVLVDDGPKWAIFEFESGDDVLGVNLDMTELSRISEVNGWTGLGLFGPKGENEYEMRNIAPVIGVPEDPACGSGAGAVGAYLGTRGKQRRFSISQGCCIGRDARLTVDLSKRDNELVVKVGGQAITCFKGEY
ncbi:Antisense-enhancing sequence 1 [Spathaspora sp. JA1]|nr:Antisense-enhancing sequence 1 [Spathaspora sp. JA1]